MSDEMALEGEVRAIVIKAAARASQPVTTSER
jgi:hypothetical protein